MMCDTPPGAPSPEEFDAVIRAVRGRIPGAIDGFAAALRGEHWQELPADSPEANAHLTS